LNDVCKADATFVVEPDTRTIDPSTDSTFRPSRFSCPLTAETAPGVAPNRVANSPVFKNW